MVKKKRSSLCIAIAVVALAGLAVLLPSQALAQKTFPSAEAAADALVDAVARNDSKELRTVLGENWKRFIPTEGVDQDDVDAFLAAWKTSHSLEPDADNRVHLAVGPDKWTLPIPIVKKGDAWSFDVKAGAEEIRTRRIGRNELSAMQAALAYYDAQKDYALSDRNRDGVLEYAQKLVSSPGTHDGLYWPTKPGEAESPLGPVFGNDRPGSDYHGYYFKIIKGQGKHAPGGAYDYRIKGRMTSGFALVAWPVKYGDSGVMTFVVSHAGQVYEKNLGPNTDAAAHAMTLFNPDSSWRKVSP
jgi:hypothetical protein